jgi:hypothetical protein
MKYREKLGLDTIVKEIKEGNNPAKICLKYNISKQTLSSSTTKLQALGCIEKSDIYGKWNYIKEVPICPKDTIKVNSDIRGHAFIWNIEFMEHKLNWAQVEENYNKRRDKKSIKSFDKIGLGKVTRIFFKNRKIWLTKTGLTIYESMEFLDKSSFTVKGTAVFEMDRLIKDLVKELGLNIQDYRFKCSREHYAHVRNQIARQFNEDHIKIKVKYDDKWFWIDHSHGDQEEETNDPDISVQAKGFYLSQVKTKFQVTPEKILDGFKESAKQIKENAENLAYHAENMRSHVGATRDLSAAAIKLNENIEKQNMLFMDMIQFFKDHK